jgi:Glycosyl hydrolase family 63 C-terminal domain
LPTAEHGRLAANAEPPHLWYRWGPYVSERQWGTVREDYSADGSAWEYLSHDQARSRAYRWGEDGIGGFSDRHGLLNFTVAMWNGQDPILKERLFGLTNKEGNHGEDVKELYYYLDAVPSGAYLKMLYRYPIAAFPYEQLVRVNQERGAQDPEFELLDTGVFDRNAFFDVVVEYAKADPDDILWRVTVTNHAAVPAPFWLIPQITARNNWSWGRHTAKPEFRLRDGRIEIDTVRYGRRNLAFDAATSPIFTENLSNDERLHGTPNSSPFVKDAFHRLVVEGESQACNPAMRGTKVGFLASGTLAPGAARTLRFRFAPQALGDPFEAFDRIFAVRIAETAEFYAAIQVDEDPEKRRIQRQAFAGLIWSKQFYHYEVERWANGDAGQFPPPKGHQDRNAGWNHFHAGEVLSMPDKWEYPWFASWDLAFHAVAFTLIDPRFAKDQLLLIMREWYMHPSGQIPAYEWQFSDANPPVHAWAAHRVFRIERRLTGKADFAFLEKAFQKLLLNFTWWTNRKDVQGNNVFEGGFLGLDNIGIFDRGMALPYGMLLEQSDGTSWMAMFCLNMLGMALELAARNRVYEDIATKFLEHFIYIASAMHKAGMWDEADGFYYDTLSKADGQRNPIKLRSMVGLLPVIACVAVDATDLDKLEGFKARMNWFLEHRPDLASGFAHTSEFEHHTVRVFSLVDPRRLKRILSRMLDEQEFFSPYGVRALSKAYAHSPFEMALDGQTYHVKYTPAESETRLFGGNSNWRGPVWFPVNYLLIEALQRHGYFLGKDWKVECPTGSGRSLSLDEVASEISRRLVSIFVPDETGRRPVHEDARYACDPIWKDLLLFFEYFHGDNGRGVGASHQTGWTAVVAKLIDQLGIFGNPGESKG